MFKFIALAILLISSSQLFAGYPCQEEMESCSHHPRRPTYVGGKFLAHTYVEVSSPNCEENDLDLAIKEASTKARKQAEDAFGTLDVVQTSLPEIHKLCGKGIYADSNKEISWIVVFMVNYTLK